MKCEEVCVGWRRERIDCYNKGGDRWGNKSFKSITTPRKEKGVEEEGGGGKVKNVKKE